MWKTSGILIFFFVFHTVITSPIGTELGFGFQESDCSKSTQGSSIACKASIKRWKWSVDNGTCVESIYGGCNPSRNNFRTYDDCIKVAEPICSKENTVTTSTGSTVSSESTTITTAESTVFYTSSTEY
ncbi:hypothetical protein JTB14_014201 [Gonioctena quinquepunctata]|nr:hypothetical protein JTB14_014201 [Gonioctena quinquepunctata]